MFDCVAVDDNRRTIMPQVVYADFARQLERENAELREALRKIVDDGDFTAPEGMKRIARAALQKVTP
jgi:hypothetical protein